MSGSISPPPMAPQGGMPQQSGLPPQILAMLMAAAAQRQGAGPMQPAVGGPMQSASGGPMQAAVGGPMPQSPMPQVPSQQQMPAPMPGGMSNSYANAAAQKGRFGDSMMAHMTPGEIAVPPQVQTPGVLAALQQAFKQAGADVRQFAAGSPFAAHNPDTGQQEFSLWSALLPVVGGIVGSIIPGAGTAAGTALGGAVGGAAGGLAGGLIDHQTPIGTLLSAAGGGLGGYMGAGGGFGSLTGSGGAAAGGAASVAPNTSMSAGQAALINAASNAAAQPVTSAELAQLPSATSSPSFMSMAKTGMGAGMGSGIGASLAPPPANNNNGLPDGFNKPMPPVNPNLPIGGRPAGATPAFTGYNPYTAVTGSPFSFFPTT